MDTPAPAEPSDSPFKRILNFFGINRSPDSPEEIEQEIGEIIDEGLEQGLIGREEGEMISSILEFRDTLVREVMTPRSDMISARADIPIAEIIQLITQKGYTRIPIYQDTPDNIIGVLHAKDLLPFCLDSADMPAVSHLAKPPFFVMDTRKIINLLKDFQTKKIHLAIVTDEFGSVRGLVTMEDVLEEIVGEIRDESDKIERRLRVVDKNLLLADAKVDIEEIEEFFGVTLPEGHYESVGGLIISHLDRVPPVGATMLINSLIFEVLSADTRRIHTVKIQRKPE